MMKRLLCLVSVGIICTALPEPQADPATDGSKTPDVSNILNTLGSSPDLSSILSLVKDFKAAGDLYKVAMENSPLAKQILQAVAAKNAKVRVLVGVAEGKIPDVKDLYEMMTSKPDSVATDFSSVLTSNRQWRRLVSLMRKKDFATSKDDMQNFLYLLTGKKYDIGSALVLNQQSGKYSVTADTGNRYRNLVEWTIFFQQNFDAFQANLLLGMGNPPDYVAMLRNDVNKDYSHLADLRQEPTLVSGGKYTVAKADPDVAELMQLVKSGETLLHQRVTDQTKAKEMDVAISRKSMAIIGKAFTHAQGGIVSVDKPAMVG